MTTIIPQHMTAELNGEFVVFLIGMRINKPWRVDQWLPVAQAMPRMLRELAQNSDLGCLAIEGGFPTLIQYWRSFEHLEAYAKSRDHAHLPAWAAFNRRIRQSRGAVGIWHETYKIAPGHHESIYYAMPAMGLGRAGRLVPVARGKASARQRLDAGVQPALAELR